MITHAKSLDTKATALPGAKKQKAAEETPFKPVVAKAQETPVEDSFTSSEGYVSAGLTLAGGLTTLAGVMMNEPTMITVGTTMVVGGSAATAWRVQKSGQIDSAAKVAFAGVGVMALAGAASFLPESKPSEPLLIEILQSRFKGL